MGEDTRFDIENGIAVETSKKSQTIRIHEGTKSNFQNIGTRDDPSGSDSDSVIPPSVSSDTTPVKISKRFRASKSHSVRDDQLLEKCNIKDYFEPYGVPDSKPSCPMAQCKGHRYHDRSSLLRHLKQQHKVSKQLLEEIKPTIPTPKEKTRCLICSWKGLKTNRPEHFEKHIRERKEAKIKAALEAKAQLERKAKEQKANEIAR